MNCKNMVQLSLRLKNEDFFKQIFISETPFELLLYICTYDKDKHLSQMSQLLVNFTRNPCNRISPSINLNLKSSGNSSGTGVSKKT